MNAASDHFVVELQGLVGAVFEGVGVSTGSLIGGRLMNTIRGSATFRIFSYGAFFFFGLHVLVQWLLTKITGPYGKKSSPEVDDDADKASNEAIEVSKSNEGDKLEDGFKNIDLTK